jgi:hypothetical protein
MPTIDSVTFDATGMTALGSENADPTVRGWQASDGDQITLNFFARRPNLPADLDRLDDLRAGFRRILAKQGLALIELETVVINGCRAVWLIVKAPQKPHGMTYIGSLTFPFRNFSFVLKAVCVEHGTTGMREAVVLERFLAERDERVESGGVDNALDGWQRDPFDPSYQAPLMRNLAEDEQYDAQFPKHPLSRVRRFLRSLYSTVLISDELKRTETWSG